MFAIDEEKRVDQLSSGMKVKYLIALALSHDARLLILDEPTSGLDPVSRDDLTELFRALVADGKRTVLFSTHITSDLDKCADYITYIKDGCILSSVEKDAFCAQYRLVRGPRSFLAEEGAQHLIGVEENAFGFGALCKSDNVPQGLKQGSPYFVWH